MRINVARAGIGLVLVMLGTTPSRAQDQPAVPATTAAHMDVHGAVDVGYRWTDVSGSSDMYRRLFDLTDGLRLTSLDVSGNAPRTADLFADAFGLSASGIGDPFSGVQFTMRKARRYDVRVNWRNSRFRDTWPLTPTSIDGLDTQAVTDHHAWTTSRQIGDVGVVFDATDRLHLLFNYSRVARTGALESTRSLDFIGAPSIWGNFARANPYPVTTPVDDSANRFSGGLSFSAARWTITYQAGYQRYVESQELAPVSSSERSINVADPTTAGELLTALSSSQARRLSSPLSELSFVVTLAPKVEWRGAYLFSRYQGPFDLNAAYHGSARTNSAATILSPYDVVLTANGTASSPSNVLDQSLTYHVADPWTIEADYRYSRFSSDASGLLTSTLATFPTGTAAPTQTVENDEESWRQSSHSIALMVKFEPSATLSLQPGIRYSHRDVEHRVDGAIEPPTTQRGNTVSPEIMVAYRPVSQLSVRGSYRTANSDASYTRLSPSDRSIAHLAVRYEPVEGLAIEASADKSDAEWPAAAFVSHTRWGSAQASYKAGERLTVLGGIDYQSFLGLGSVSFVRGTAPIADDEMTDRERDRIWLVGAVVKATDRLGVTATANFLRTTGTDSIAGEPPLYGPQSFPYGTGSVYYDVPRAGRITLDLQRAHLQQDILSLNDFRATLVMLRFSREF